MWGLEPKVAKRFFWCNSGTSRKKIRTILNQASGVTVLDSPVKNEYPMPINTSKKDEVFVGRIRKDFTEKNTLNIWIVADNLRKGAATNTVQIAEHLIAKNLV